MRSVLYTVLVFDVVFELVFCVCFVAVVCVRNASCGVLLWVINGTSAAINGAEAIGDMSNAEIISNRIVNPASQLSKGDLVHLGVLSIQCSAIGKITAYLGGKKDVPYGMILNYRA